MSLQRLNRWKSLARYRDQRKRVAELELVRSRQELESADEHWQRLQASFQQMMQHCAQRLIAAPYAAEHFQTALTQLRHQVDQAKQRRDAAHAAWDHRRQQALQQRMEAEKVDLIHQQVRTEAQVEQAARDQVAMNETILRGQRRAESKGGTDDA